jgi:PAS domain S-box-containing protein
LVAFLLLSIARRRRAEMALAERERRLRAVFDSAAAGIAHLDAGGRFLSANAVFCRMLGYSHEEMAGKPACEVVAAEERPALRESMQAVAQGEIPGYRVERRYLRKDGGTFLGEAFVTAIPGRSGRAEGAIAVILDITERKRAAEERRRLEAQVQHAQKLESLGILAGGIAHDFNNLLAAILGNADLALMEMSGPSSARQSVEEVRKAAIRASELTNQMLAYSGKGRFIVRVIDLNGLVAEMAGLLEVSMSKKVALECDFAEDLPAVEADAAQIRQIVMNLITNAADAIGDVPGTITARTRTVQVDQDRLAPYPLPKGRYVCLEVADTGCGMNEQTKARLFDPFFTTKFTGRGLGLAAVQGIVRGHNGAIEVHSELGKGSTFRVLLPASLRPAEPSEAPPAADHCFAAHDGATVLVVDDEDAVRGVAKAILERMGLNVLTARDGRDGVRVFSEHADEIAVVLMDMTMPDMDGREAFHEIRGIRPEAKVILSSGYSEEDVSARFGAGALAGFVHKPYEREELLRKVGEALASTPR